jgi:cytochrome c peroxidase
MKNLRLLLSFTLVLLFFSSCLEEKVDVLDVDVNENKDHYTQAQWEAIFENLTLPAVPLEYNQPLSAHLRLSGLISNPVNNDKATLGRVLFYDTRLSENQSVSCASCHDQSLAFSDNVAFSEGFKGQRTKRNSIALGSVVSFASYYSSEENPFGIRFFWDERARSSENQSALSIEDQIEMGMQLGDVKKRLQGIDYYEALFETAYGEEGITETTILDAVGEFINAIGSSNSKFDKAATASGLHQPFRDLDGLTQIENEGKLLFMNNCSNCHGTSLSLPRIRTANIGLDASYQDQGVGAISNKSEDDGVFKVPALRNIELTAPYMHDGRFETLEEVIEFYSTGIQNHKNLHTELKEVDPVSGQLVPRKFNFRTDEKEALIAFLKTLTDEEFLTAERFSNPFK